MRPTIPPQSLFPSLDEGTVSINYKVVVCTADGIRAFPLTKEKPYGIGRGHLNDIVIAHDSVSRNHAVLHGGDPPVLEDLGSRNGTLVDGRRLAPGERVPLHGGKAI